MWQSICYFANRYLLRRPFLVAKANQYGMRFRFKTEDVVGRHIYKYGSFEEATTRALAKQVRLGPGDIALDIGANIGWYSVLLDRLASPGASVLAFEPDPLNFRLLQENLALNATTKVEAIQSAVADADTTMRLYLYGTKNLGRHSLLPINQGQSVEVKTVAMDALLTGRGYRFEQVKFIKMDVEGYELFVLKGMPRLLQSVPLIFMEYSPETMRRNQIDPCELLRLMSHNGFSPHTAEREELQPLLLSDLEISKVSQDLIWLRSSPIANAAARPANH